MVTLPWYAKEKRQRKRAENGLPVTRTFDAFAMSSGFVHDAWMQTAGHKMAAPMVRFLPLSDVSFSQTGPASEWKKYSVHIFYLVIFLLIFPIKRWCKIRMQTSKFGGESG